MITTGHGFCSANNSIVSHQVRSICDMDNDATTFFMWDASGRLQVMMSGISSPEKNVMQKLDMITSARGTMHHLCTIGPK